MTSEPYGHSRLLCVCCSFADTFSALPFRPQEPHRRAGRDGAERNGTGPTRTVTATRDGRQAGATGTSSFILLYLLLSSSSRSSSFLLSLFPWSTTTGGAGWDVTDAGATATRDGGATGTHSVVFLFFFLYSPFSSSPSSSFPIIYSTTTGGTGRDGTGRDGTGAGRDVNDAGATATRDWTGGTGTCSVIFLIFFLYSPLFFFSLFFFSFFSALRSRLASICSRPEEHGGLADVR